MKHETEQCGVKTTHRLYESPQNINALTFSSPQGWSVYIEERPPSAASQWQIRRAPESEGLDFQSSGVDMWKMCLQVVYITEANPLFYSKKPQTPQNKIKQIKKQNNFPQLRCAICGEIVWRKEGMREGLNIDATNGT